MMFTMRRLPALLLSCVVMASCTGDGGSEQRHARGPDEITIGDFRGMNHAKAAELISNLDLVVEIEETPLPPTSRQSEPLEAGTILEQDPAPDTKVAPGTTITFFVTQGRDAASKEEPFKLLAHCGLSYPLDYDHRSWLPVDEKLRRTINPPRGFASDGYYVRGSIRRVDVDTLIYVSSTGKEVEYAPTDLRGGGCE